MSIFKRNKHNQTHKIMQFNTPNKNKRIFIIGCDNKDKTLKECIIDAIGEDEFINRSKSAEIDQMYDDIEHGIYSNQPFINIHHPCGIIHVDKNPSQRCVLQTSKCKIWYDNTVKLYMCKIHNTVVCGFPSKKKVINYLCKHYCKVCSYKCGKKIKGVKA